MSGTTIIAKISLSLSKSLILRQYLNHDVDCMFIVMYHWQKSENCNLYVKEPSKLQNVIE